MAEFPPLVIHAARNDLPVLLSVPHSGQSYDREALDNARQGQRSLETLEDPLVDRLVWRAVASGFGAVIQPVPRAVIDCNRHEEEVDPAAIEGISPAPVGQRARYGLGLIPSRTHRHGFLWRRPISKQELQRRISQVHRPFHRAIEVNLQSLAARHGCALLLDCHSMPPRRGGQPIVIGDRHGNSAAPDVTTAAVASLQTMGYSTAINTPYAGGAIVERHGQPSSGIHALQLEFDRSLYLSPDLRNAGAGFDRLAFALDRLARDLGNHLLGTVLAEAAE